MNEQRHRDQLTRWAGLHGFTPEAGEVVDAFCAAMGDNQYGVEETWDAYCWFRNGFNAAGAKVAPIASEAAPTALNVMGLAPKLYGDKYALGSVLFFVASDVPAGEIHLRDGHDGRLLGKIINVGEYVPQE